MAAMLITCGSAMAQRQRMTEEERQKQRQEMIDRQAERMAKDLDLKDDAKTAFMEKYKAYQTELMAVMGDEQRRGRDEEGNFDKMTDEECYGKVKEALERQEKQVEQAQKRLEITKKYLTEFMATLTPQQLAKVFAQRQRNNGGQGFGGGRGFGGGGQGGFGGGRGGFGGPGGGFGGGQ